MHESCSGVCEDIAGSLITGHFKWKPAILKAFFAFLPYQGVSESLTDTKLEGPFLVMRLELEKKHTMKKVRQLEKNFNVNQHIKIIHLVCLQLNTNFQFYLKIPINKYLYL